MVSSLLLAGCAGKNTQENQIKRADIHYQIGLDALHKNQLPKAFDELMKAESMDPTRADVLDALGYAWRVRGNFKKAEGYYKRALRLQPGAATYNNYGSLLLEMGRYEDAKKQLLKALEDPRYPNQYLAYINLGDALLGLNYLDDAVLAYRQASTFNPRQVNSRIKEAEAYVVYNRLNYAQALYETILREAPGNRSALEGLLKVLMLRNDYPTARSQLKAFQIQPLSELDRAWAADELEKLNRP